MKKVVIVGGGTAGWLTALCVEKFWENTEVTLIASSKIGILGAGEGTTPNFPGIISKLAINEEDFIKKTGCTKKYGIDFVNWRGDNHRFNHNFQKDARQYAFHFDASLVAKYFQEIGIERGITHIDSFVKGFNEDENGITQIILEDDTTVDCDFVFDCTGFQRMIIGKHFKTKWISYKEDLPCDSAFAFFLPQTNPNIGNEKTWTKGIAMKNGWIWGAPLQHRWGCGYVYSSAHATFEEVLKETEEYYQQPINVVKQFKFDAGTYEKFWVKNSVAIGLAGSFLEPLEATSLMTTIMFIRCLMNLNWDEKNRDEFNGRMLNVNEQNMLFIRHHYHCDRDDTQFWRDIKNNTQPQKLLDLYDENGNFISLRDNQLNKKFTYDGNSSCIFNWGSWFTVHKGKSNLYKEII